MACLALDLGPEHQSWNIVDLISLKLLSSHLLGALLVIKSATWEISFELPSLWPFSACQQGTRFGKLRERVEEGTSPRPPRDNMTECRGHRGIVLVSVSKMRRWLLLPAWYSPGHKGSHEFRPVLEQY